MTANISDCESSSSSNSNDDEDPICARINEFMARLKEPRKKDLFKRNRRKDSSPLRPSIIDRAIKKNAVSSTPMPGTSRRRLTFSSEISEIDPGAASVEQSKKIDTPAREQVAQTSEREPVELINRVDAATEVDEELVQRNNQSVVNSNKKNVSRSMFRHIARQTQTGNSLQRNNTLLPSSASKLLVYCEKELDFPPLLNIFYHNPLTDMDSFKDSRPWRFNNTSKSTSEINFLTRTPVLYKSEKSRKVCTEPRTYAQRRRSLRNLVASKFGRNSEKQANDIIKELSSLRKTLREDDESDSDFIEISSDHERDISSKRQEEENLKNTGKRKDVSSHDRAQKTDATNQSPHKGIVENTTTEKDDSKKESLKDTGRRKVLSSATSRDRRMPSKVQSQSHIKHRSRVIYSDESDEDTLIVENNLQPRSIEKNSKASTEEEINNSELNSENKRSLRLRNMSSSRSCDRGTQPNRSLIQRTPSKINSQSYNTRSNKTAADEDAFSSTIIPEKPIVETVRERNNEGDQKEKVSNVTTRRGRTRDLASSGDREVQLTQKTPSKQNNLEVRGNVDEENPKNIGRRKNVPSSRSRSSSQKTPSKINSNSFGSNLVVGEPDEDILPVPEDTMQVKKQTLTERNNGSKVAIETNDDSELSTEEHREENVSREGRRKNASSIKKTSSKVNENKTMNNCSDNETELGLSTSERREKESFPNSHNRETRPKLKSPSKVNNRSVSRDRKIIISNNLELRGMNKRETQSVPCNDGSGEGDALRPQLPVKNVEKRNQTITIGESNSHRLKGEEERTSKNNIKERNHNKYGTETEEYPLQTSSFADDAFTFTVPKDKHNQSRCSKREKNKTIEEKSSAIEKGRRTRSASSTDRGERQDKSPSKTVTRNEEDNNFEWENESKERRRPKKKTNQKSDTASLRENSSSHGRSVQKNEKTQLNISTRSATRDSRSVVVTGPMEEDIHPELDCEEGTPRKRQKGGDAFTFIVPKDKPNQSRRSKGEKNKTIEEKSSTTVEVKKTRSTCSTDREVLQDKSPSKTVTRNEDEINFELGNENGERRPKKKTRNQKSDTSSLKENPSSHSRRVQQSQTTQPNISSRSVTGESRNTVSVEPMEKDINPEVISESEKEIPSKRTRRQNSGTSFRSSTREVSQNASLIHDVNNITETEKSHLQVSSHENNIPFSTIPELGQSQHSKNKKNSSKLYTEDEKERSSKNTGRRKRKNESTSRKREKTPPSTSQINMSATTVNSPGCYIQSEVENRSCDKNRTVTSDKSRESGEEKNRKRRNRTKSSSVHFSPSGIQQERLQETSAINKSHNQYLATEQNDVHSTTFQQPQSSKAYQKKKEKKTKPKRTRTETAVNNEPTNISELAQVSSCISESHTELEGVRRSTRTRRPPPARNRNAIIFKSKAKYQWFVAPEKGNETKKRNKTSTNFNRSVNSSSNKRAKSNNKRATDNTRNKAETSLSPTRTSNRRTKNKNEQIPDDTRNNVATPLSTITEDVNYQLEVINREHSSSNSKNSREISNVPVRRSQEDERQFDELNSTQRSSDVSSQSVDTSHTVIDLLSEYRQLDNNPGVYFSTKVTGSEDFSLGFLKLDGGATMKKRVATDDVTYYTITSGEAEVKIGRRKHTYCRKESFITISKGQKYSIKNLSKSEPVILNFVSHIKR